MAKIKIQGNASGTGVLTITSPNTNTDRTITLPDSSVTLGAATPSITDNGNANAITIDSSERVGIGESSPFTKLHVKEGDSGATSVWGDTGLVVEGSADARMTLLSGASNIGSIKFGDSGLNRQGGIDYNHNGDAMTFATVNTERLRLTSDGRGLSQFTAKAWVNFNGTGTLAIRDSHNVSSVVDYTGTGKYAINFSNSMANSNYSLNGCARSPAGLYAWFMEENNSPLRTSSTVRIAITLHDNSTSVDCDYISAQVFGD